METISLKQSCARAKIWFLPTQHLSWISTLSCVKRLKMRRKFNLPAKKKRNEKNYFRICLGFTICKTILKFDCVRNTTNNYNFRSTLDNVSGNRHRRYKTTKSHSNSCFTLIPFQTDQLHCELVAEFCVWYLSRVNISTNIDKMWQRKVQMQFAVCCENDFVASQIYRHNENVQNQMADIETRETRAAKRNKTENTSNWNEVSHAIGRRLKRYFRVRHTRSKGSGDQRSAKINGTRKKGRRKTRNVVEMSLLVMTLWQYFSYFFEVFCHEVVFFFTAFSSSHLSSFSLLGSPNAQNWYGTTWISSINLFSILVFVCRSVPECQKRMHSSICANKTAFSSCNCFL